MQKSVIGRPEVMLLFLLSLVLSLGQARAMPVLRADSNLVLVPAVVTDGDYPIRDLTSQQFELRVDGQPAPLAQPGDEYALALCRRQASLDLPFTSGLSALSRKVLSVTAQGSTPLFDAIDLAINVSHKSKNRQRYVLAFQPEQGVHDNKHHSLDVRVHDISVTKPKVFGRRDYIDSEATVQ